MNIIPPRIRGQNMQLTYSDSYDNYTYESSFGDNIKITINWYSDVKNSDSTIELFGVRIRTFFNCSSLQEAAKKAEDFLFLVGNTLHNCGFYF